MNIRVLLAAGLFVALPSWAAETGHLTVEELRQIRLPDIVLESVEHKTPAAKNSKPHVEVNGVIGEHIHQSRLPLLVEMTGKSGHQIDLGIKINLI